MHVRHIESQGVNASWWRSVHVALDASAVHGVHFFERDLQLLLQFAQVLVVHAHAGGRQGRQVRAAGLGDRVETQRHDGLWPVSKEPRPDLL